MAGFRAMRCWPTARPTRRCSSGSGYDERLIISIKIDGCWRRNNLPAQGLGKGKIVITPQYIRVMARYNSEMNRRVYAGAARLTDEQRREDIGLFWKSLHGTLCHLLWADRQWMSRLDGWPPNTIPNPQSPTLIDDFAELRAERENADSRIEDFA